MLQSSARILLGLFQRTPPSTYLCCFDQCSEPTSQQTMVWTPSMRAVALVNAHAQLQAAAAAAERPPRDPLDVLNDPNIPSPPELPQWIQNLENNQRNAPIRVQTDNPQMRQFEQARLEALQAARTLAARALLAGSNSSTSI